MRQERSILEGLRSIACRLRAAAEARPVLVIALLGLATSAANVWWLTANRFLGGLDADETDYLRRAVELSRGHDLWGARAFGPVQPIISAVLMRLGPANLTSALLAGPVMHAVTATAAAGIARRLAGPGTALLAGLVVLGYPAAIMEARTYQLGGAATMGAAIALWALVESDRGERRPQMIVVGLGVGLMVMGRTMAIGYLPAMAIGTAYLAAGTARGRRNLVWAAGATIVSAGPWLLNSWAPIMHHLVSQGYGPDAAQWAGPQANPAMRPVFRLMSFVESGRLVGLVLAVGATGAVWRAARRGPRTWRPEIVAVCLVIGVGMLALASTKNLGTWFDLPLLVPVLVLATVALTHLTAPRRRRIERVVVAVATVSILLSFTDHGGGGDPRSPLSVARAAFSGNFADHVVVSGEDGKVTVGDPAVRRRSAERWWALSDAVLDVVAAQRVGDGDVDVRLIGANNQHLFGNNELLLAAELSDRRWIDVTRWSYLSVADLDEAPDDRSAGRSTVLLVIDNPRFPSDATSSEVTAFRAGYTEIARLALPRGGTVTAMVPPARTAR